MKPCFARNASHLTYLEPPHLHNPSSVSGVASLPTSTLDTLPESVQSALYNLQQSTSIVYASFLRLQEMLQERFERLIPSLDPDGETTFSESSFFNYINSLSAEKRYMLSDAHPDWRHKASLARVAIQPYVHQHIDLGIRYLGSPNSISQWWESLQSAVDSWCDYVRVVHVPDYEDTVGEYLAIQKQTPTLAVDLDDTPLETPLETLTPTLEKESEHVHIYEIQDRDFVSPLLREDHTMTRPFGLGLTGAAGIDNLGKKVPHEYPLRDAGMVRDERKDSGIGLAN